MQDGDSEPTGIGSHHHYVPMRKINQFDDTIDHRIAQGNERVDTS